MSKQRLPTEHAEQCAVASWLRRRGVWFFAVPNGAKMGAAEAAKMKREGLRPGVPDLLIVDRGRLLALEMKARESGRPTPEQNAAMEHLTSQGWDCGVCHGAKEAIQWLRERLGID